MLRDTSATSTKRAPVDERTMLKVGLVFDINVGGRFLSAKSLCFNMTDHTLCEPHMALCLLGASQLCLWKLPGSSSQKCAP